MRANHSLAGTEPHLVIQSNPSRRGRDFFWPRSLRGDPTAIYSLPVRMVIGVGLSLALWLLIGLSVSMVV